MSTTIASATATATTTATLGVVNGHTHFSPYGYTPSAAANITFLAIFSILTTTHLIMGIKFHTWYFTIVFVLGGLGEIIGYIARVGSAYDVTYDIYFIMQICCLIFAPAFFSAALYLAMGTLFGPSFNLNVAHLRSIIVGTANSLLKPMQYIIIFSCFDILALAIQAIGGAKAAKAQQDGTSTTSATDFMEVGIVIQGIGNLVFTAAAALLWYRTRKNCRAKGCPTPFPKNLKFKIYVVAIVVSDTMIIMRAVYRIIELAQGWRGHLITTEYYFYILDTTPMIISMAVWIAGHPGITLEKGLANPHMKGTKYGIVANDDEAAAVELYRRMI